MATLLLLTNDMRSSAEILPALELLPHQVKVAQAEATALLDAPPADVILLDAGGTWSVPARCAGSSKRPAKRHLSSSSPTRAGCQPCPPTGGSTTCCSRPRDLPRSMYDYGSP